MQILIGSSCVLRYVGLNTHDPKGNTMRIKEAVSFYSDESPEDDDIMLAMAIMLDYINNPKRDNLDWLIPASSSLPDLPVARGDLVNENMWKGTTLRKYLTDMLGGVPEWHREGWNINTDKETRWLPLDELSALIDLWDWACDWLEAKCIEIDDRIFDGADSHPLFTAEFKAEYDGDSHGQIWQCHQRNFADLRTGGRLLKAVC
jgi:hypothetical protein